MSLELGDDNFKQEIEDFSGVALVDFWAEWCGPCRQQGPIIDELSAEFRDNAQIKIAKVNVDVSPQISQKFQIRSIPTLMFFKAGKPDGQLKGVNLKDKLKAKLEELAAD